MPIRGTCVKDVHACAAMLAVGYVFMSMSIPMPIPMPVLMPMPMSMYYQVLYVYAHTRSLSGGMTVGRLQRSGLYVDRGMRSVAFP